MAKEGASWRLHCQGKTHHHGSTAPGPCLTHLRLSHASAASLSEELSFQHIVSQSWQRLVAHDGLHHGAPEDPRGQLTGESRHAHPQGSFTRTEALRHGHPSSVSLKDNVSVCLFVWKVSYAKNIRLGSLPGGCNRPSQEPAAASKSPTCVSEARAPAFPPRHRELDGRWGSGDKNRPPLQGCRPVPMPGQTHIAWNSLLHLCASAVLRPCLLHRHRLDLPPARTHFPKLKFSPHYTPTPIPTPLGLGSPHSTVGLCGGDSSKHDHQSLSL